jgi:hypothetical protein
MPDLFKDSGFTFAPDGSLFGPPGGQVDAVNRVGEHPGERFSTMSDGIGFEETGAGLIPLVRLDGDMLSKKSSGFGGSPAAPLVLDSDRGQEPIESRGRNGLESLEDLWRHRAKELTISGKP